MSAACQEAYYTVHIWRVYVETSQFRMKKSSTVLPYTCNLNLVGMSSALR